MTANGFASATARRPAPVIRTGCGDYRWSMRHSSTRSKLLRLFAIVATLALLVTACGDDDSGGDDSGGTDAPSSSGDDTTDDGSDDPAPDDGDDDSPSDRSDELNGTWLITTYQLAGAAGEATPIGDDASIEFADGTVRFNTGCNTGEGEYETFGAYQPENDDGIPEGQPISFGSLSRTEIGCEPELADQDLAIGGAIRAADLFEFDGDLVILWRDGNVMIEAQPA